MESACAASYASLYTGQHSSLHGVSLHGVSGTPGGAKMDHDPSMYWLQPRHVPTLGNYFESAGYTTFWVGKWHVTDADIDPPGSHEPVPSYNKGAPRPEVVRASELTDSLAPYGFHGWVGPAALIPQLTRPGGTSSTRTVQCDCCRSESRSIEHLSCTK